MHRSNEREGDRRKINRWRERRSGSGHKSHQPLRVAVESMWLVDALGCENRVHTRCKTRKEGENFSVSISEVSGIST